MLYVRWMGTIGFAVVRFRRGRLFIRAVFLG